MLPHSTFCGFLPRVLPLPLPLATLLVIASYSSMLHWAIEKKKKAVCDGFVFPGNLDPLSLTPGGPIVLLVCEFRRRDNLLAWRELFANLYELESRIGFWKEYNHFERIYWVHRFDRFSSNFRQNILGIMARKECREILIFKIFVSWCPFTQHTSHIFSLQP